MNLKISTFISVNVISLSLYAQSHFANKDNFAVDVQSLKQLTASSDYEVHKAILKKGIGYPPLDSEDIYGAYISPNELDPELLEPELKSKSDSLFIIGTERCFMSAAMAPQARKIHCVDFDHGAFIYNLLNLEMIRSTSNYSDYLSLKRDALPFESSYDILHGHSNAIDYQKMKNNPVYKLLRRQGLDDNFSSNLVEFWSDRVARHDKINEGYLGIYPQLNHWSATQFFKLFNLYDYMGANYNFNMLRYAQLKKHIDENRISMSWLDVANPENLNSFSNSLSQNNEKLSWVDLSNVPEYISDKDFRLFIDSLKLQKAEGSVTIATTRQKGVGVYLGRAHIGNMSEWDLKWTYYIFSDYDLTQSYSRHDAKVVELKIKLALCKKFDDCNKEKLKSEKDNLSKENYKVFKNEFVSFCGNSKTEREEASFSCRLNAEPPLSPSFYNKKTQDLSTDQLKADFPNLKILSPRELQ